MCCLFFYPYRLRTRIQKPADRAGGRRLRWPGHLLDVYMEVGIESKTFNVVTTTGREHIGNAFRRSWPKVLIILSTPLDVKQGPLDHQCESWVI